MKRIKTLLITGILLILQSCSFSNKNTFKISNQSNNVVDSLLISPDGTKNHNYIKIDLNQTINYTLNSKTFPNLDGHYTMYYMINKSGIMKEQAFGYYSNGVPLESSIDITIKNDTFLFKYN